MINFLNKKIILWRRAELGFTALNVGCKPDGLPRHESAAHTALLQTRQWGKFKLRHYRKNGGKTA